MRHLCLCCCVAVLVGCQKPKEQAAVDTTAAAAPAPEAAAPAALSLADVAGKWSMRTMAEGSDSVLVNYELAADAAGWTYNFPNRKPVPVQVQASGDSIIAAAGPFESLIRKGVQVTTNSVLRLRDGKLVGTTIAHYATSGPDTVRNLRVEGTRKE